MEIWPIDFNKSLREINEWFDGWKTERFGGDSLNPERYYETTPDEGGRYLYGVAEGESLNDERAKADKVLELLLRIKQINDKLSGRALSQHLQWREREQLKSERETLYKEFLDEVQPEPEKAAPEPQQEEANNVILPDLLNNDEAKRYFKKAINIGLIDANYKWLKGFQLLACFAREMSLRLQLGKGANSDDSPRISWKPFETLFKLPNGKLRSNYNDIQKTGQNPSNIWMIDKVFE